MNHAVRVHGGRAGRARRHAEAVARRVHQAAALVRFVVDERDLHGARVVVEVEVDEVIAGLASPECDRVEGLAAEGDETVGCTGVVVDVVEPGVEARVR